MPCSRARSEESVKCWTEDREPLQTAHRRNRYRDRWRDAGFYQMSANDQDFVQALIDMYRSLPCLWKIKSADYSNHYKKKAAYEKLVALYKEHHPTEALDENIVRKKIQALRTVYKKEMNKVKKSKKSGAGTDDVYVPKLWYYDLLAFTWDQEFPRPCHTVTSLCVPSAKEILPESPDEHVSTP
ncbi:uncharacterized protein LOC143781695 [Ranitomeya variabilis]|uniref:uncharacterized protein LOC143781695 n=1 Tax=Ranitomeya variabilis TaxID=490064 RepID=UPI0040574CC0